ncbi:MAG TPA: TetR/AcrR family transcriptional regulator [Acidimicrobiales bacterium]|nr:TetR/AcrR family transcriptional regulator [Acidimicrobiales bacterium]
MSEGLRERKKAETRKALSTAALRLAQQLGPDGVTVEAIAEAAGVSPRTFFNYFGSKEDALLGVNPNETTQLLADLVARPEGEGALEALHGMARRAAARLEAEADDMWARYELAQSHPPLAMRRAARFSEVERVLAEEIARRTGLDVDRDPYPMLAVSTALGAIRVAMAVWHDRGRTCALADAVDETFTLLARGLPSPIPAAGG